MARDSGKNGHPIAQSNLADLFFTQGNKEKAIFWAKRHIEMVPNYQTN